jgi:hypothetical protein
MLESRSCSSYLNNLLKNNEYDRAYLIVGQDIVVSRNTTFLLFLRHPVPKY